MASIDTLFAGPAGPLVIFALRIIDVSLGTVRVLLAMRNARFVVPAIAFVEILIWVVAVGNAIKHLDSPWHVLGYATGFAAGNAVGLWIEGKLAFGLASVRVVTKSGGFELADALRERGFGVTELEGEGRAGKVQLLYTVVKRRHVPDLLAEIDRLAPDAFVTVQEPREILRGWLYGMKRK